MVSQGPQEGQQQQRWRVLVKRIPAYVWVVGGSGLVFALILLGYHYKITLWGWAKLLFVPAVLAAGGLWFNRQQQERALDLGERRSQDEALQAYLDGMSRLLTDKDRPLHRAKPGDSLTTVARARTLTVLGRLDSGRKRSVLQFLLESGLIYKEHIFLSESRRIERRHNIVRLTQADVSGADLRRANLARAALSGADVSGADLIWANLARADLRKANLAGADLRRANLIWADLGETNLARANLSGAHLRGANLRGANLSTANLNGAEHITNEELEQRAASLKGATMPNGQKYEDWLKSKGRK